MNIAIIGAGNLGQAIANGILKNELATRLFLTRRKVASLSKFKSIKTVTVTSDNSAAVRHSDIIILATQPKQSQAILHNIKPVLGNNHLIISTITGFQISKIEAILGTHSCIVRAMPNTAIAVGKSMTCLSANSSGLRFIESVKNIFNSLGNTLIIPEQNMQAATVLCASGIAFWMRLIRATTQAAIQLGFDAPEAQQLAMQTASGAAELLIVNKRHPEQEIDLVTTPKGCTIEGLNEMERQGLSAALIQGMVTSFNKINTIADDN